MLILINTAKTFAQNPPPSWIIPTQAVFENETQILINELQKHSIPQLKKLMKISTAIAELNHRRYSKESNAQKTPALHAFAGEIYKKLNSPSFQRKDWAFAQNHLRILSGLYGLLRPMDAITPYRLEMYTKLKAGGKKDLYEFWKNSITMELNRQLKESESKFLINLASEEYFSAIDAKKIHCPILTITFKEKTDKGLKIIAIRSKWARGLMARYIVERQITEPEGLKGFDLEGYEFDEAQSSEENYFFVRA